MLSRTWVIDVPLSTLFRVVAMSSEVTPSWRALSCSTSTLTTRAGSIQSNTTLSRCGLERTMRSEALRKLPDFGDVGSAEAILHGAPDRRPDLEQFDERVGAGKGLSQIGSRIAP